VDLLLNGDAINLLGKDIEAISRDVDPVNFPFDGVLQENCTLDQIVAVKDTNVDLAPPSAALEDEIPSDEL